MQKEDKTISDRINSLVDWIKNQWNKLKKWTADLLMRISACVEACWNVFSKEQRQQLVDKLFDEYDLIVKEKGCHLHVVPSVVSN